MMRVLLLACLIVLGTPWGAAAQTFTRELTLTLAPSYPGPHETVYLSVSTFALDLQRSTVAWFVNDREIARGIGRTEATVVAGALGQESRIRVIAEDDEGTLGLAEAVIRPTEIDLLWEADSYVPPLYRGRALPGTNSPIRAHAITRFVAPGGTQLADEGIVFTWYKNGTIVAEGRGKSRVTVPGPSLFGTDTLRVVAQSADRTLSGEARAQVTSVDPFVILHENHPLFGVLYHRSLERGATTMETEQKVTAVPYFASIRSPSDPGLQYAWSVNGVRIAPDTDEPQTLTLTAEGYTGPADIALELMSSADVLLRAVGEWQLVFGAHSSFLSGLNPFGGN